MKVDKTLVDKLADLAKLDFNEEEEKEIISDLNKMVDFVDKLKEIPVEGVEPLIYMNDEIHVLREDEVKMEITKAEALSNAPLADSDYFKVPKAKSRQ
ncbi:MAG: Asp-tRNA(Asn)/Glu-tRNA(Gln) amidotransferase subunit GatC [Chitinophagales bacterium]